MDIWTYIYTVFYFTVMTISKMDNRFIVVPRNAGNEKAAKARLADILAQLSKKVKNPPLSSGG